MTAKLERTFDLKVTQQRFGLRQASGDAATCSHGTLGLLAGVRGGEQVSPVEGVCCQEEGTEG